VCGLAFGSIPWLASLLLLLPAFGGGWLGLGLGAGLIPLLGEVLRNGLFGVGLGTSYALLYAARQPQVPAATGIDEPLAEVSTPETASPEDTQPPA
jgi:hypothetical protein